MTLQKFKVGVFPEYRTSETPDIVSGEDVIFPPIAAEPQLLPSCHRR